ncbi:GntP family permease [Treponema socranskii]|nr:SLC13 family permease [Treponema socranskii]
MNADNKFLWRIYMTPIAFIIMLAVAVVILTFLTLRLKMHPIMVLFITATFCGLVSGKGLVNTFSSITNYFGSTLGAIGIMIIFGAIIAAGISDTGAATSIVNFFIRLFRGKHLELAPSLTGFIMSIPVFGDIAIILNAPISAVLAKRKNMSMAQMAPFVNLGLTLTHGLVPPTPGILAVSVLLGADIGTVILWGLVCSCISFAICYLVLCPIYAKGEYIEPLPVYTEGIESVPDTSSVEQLIIKEDNTPNALTAFLPLLLPAFMIAIGSIGKLNAVKDSSAYIFFNTFGNTVLALFCGIICVGLLVFGRKQKVIAKANADGIGYTVSDKSSWFEIVMNNWIGRAIYIAISALLITAMGGAMGGILRENEAIKTIGNIIGSTSFPAILVPFLLAAILMIVCGSMTTASMTAAGIMAGMISVLNISPVTSALAIGAGSMVGWHINNSGFWIFTSLYGFDTKQGLKYFTTTNALGGIVAFIFLVIFNFAGLIP